MNNIKYYDCTLAYDFALFEERPKKKANITKIKNKNEVKVKNSIKNKRKNAKSIFINIFLSVTVVVLIVFSLVLNAELYDVGLKSKEVQNINTSLMAEKRRLEVKYEAF